MCLTQGINARMLTDETAAALGSLDYRDTTMVRKRLYTAWGNRRDQARRFGGLERLVAHAAQYRPERLGQLQESTGAADEDTREMD